MIEQWTALVAPDARVTEALDAIAADAIDFITSPPQPTDKVDDLVGCGLYLGYLALAREDQELADHAGTAVERALEASPTAPGPALFGGYGAAGWLAAHLDGQVVDLSEASPEGVITRSLRAALDDPRMHFDLISGLAGVSVCAAEYGSASGDEVLREVLTRLEPRCLPDGELPPFFIPPEHVSDLKIKDYGRGYVDLGIAHGVPGVLGALVTLHARLPSERARILPVLRRLTDFMIARVPPPGEAFVNAYEPVPRPAGAPPAPRGRYAWCYGTPGLVPVMRLAGQLLGDAEVVRTAETLALRAAAASERESGVFDVSLCHGAAGLAMLFARLFHDTGDAAHADAARVWTQRTLAARQPGESRTGFRALYLEDKPRWVEERAMLLGGTGVGLALLAVTSTISPDWDRILMTSFVDAL